jgi:hypothetical protein
VSETPTTLLNKIVFIVCTINVNITYHAFTDLKDKQFEKSDFFFKLDYHFFLLWRIHKEYAFSSTI